MIISLFDPLFVMDNSYVLCSYNTHIRIVISQLPVAT